MLLTAGAADLGARRRPRSCRPLAGAQARPIGTGSRSAGEQGSVSQVPSLASAREDPLIRVIGGSVSAPVWVVVQALNAAHGIVTQAWSPIGGITFYRTGQHTSTLQDPVISDIAKAHHKTPAQVMVRWHLQQGRSVVPKSTNPARIAESIDVCNFDLTTDELAAIDALDTGRRGGLEPESITQETHGRPIPED